MMAVVGDILKDAEFSVPAFEPIVVTNERVYSAGDDAFSLGQIDAIFARELDKLDLTDVERAIWTLKYKRWKA
jgi:hypothetical protein